MTANWKASYSSALIQQTLISALLQLSLTPSKNLGQGQRVKSPVGNYGM